MLLSSWVDKKDVPLEVQPSVLQDSPRVGVWHRNSLFVVGASKMHRETDEPGLNLILFNFYLVLEALTWSSR